MKHGATLAARPGPPAVSNAGLKSRDRPADQSGMLSKTDTSNVDPLNRAVSKATLE